MKAKYKVGANVIIEVEGDKLVDVLDQLNEVNEALGPEPCGKCGKTNTLPRVRTVGEDKFYEIQCKDCWAVLQLGIHKDASKTLYKKRAKTDGKGKVMKDENDKSVYLPNKGWLKWDKEKKEMV